MLRSAITRRLRRADRDAVVLIGRRVAESKVASSGIECRRAERVGS